MITYSSNELRKANQDTMDEDLQLIEQFRQGDERAFEKLVKKYQSRVFHLIYGFTRNPDEVEDYAQEVFIRIYYGLHKFKQEARFSTWLQRVALNYCIDEARKKSGRWLFPWDQIQKYFNIEKSDEPPGDLNPLQELERKEQTDILRQALEKLSPEHRAIITLREFEEYSYEEIAKILGLSVGTVKSRLWRARHELQNILKPFMKE